MTAAGITEIGLDYGPCWHSSPEFRVTLSRSGSYHDHGERNVRPLGRRTGTVPGWMFDRLAGACEALGVLDLDDLYPAPAGGTQSTAITVRHAGGVRVVRREAGADEPPRR